MQLLVLINRDTTTVIFHGAAAIGIDSYFHFRAVASHSLVDTVVYGLIDKVMETFLGDVTDIHGRAFAHGFQTL